jgi:hypothetical protein
MQYYTVDITEKTGTVVRVMVKADNAQSAVIRALTETKAPYHFMRIDVTNANVTRVLE